MILYHFTYEEFLKDNGSILTDGLLPGTALPDWPRDWPRDVVWFCEDADPASWIANETLEDRVRIKVAIQASDKKLMRFETWARQHWSLTA
jgi:hypothetical protein